MPINIYIYTHTHTLGVWWDLCICGGVNFFALGISMIGKHINPKFGWNEIILIKRKRKKEKEKRKAFEHALHISQLNF